MRASQLARGFAKNVQQACQEPKEPREMLGEQQMGTADVDGFRLFFVVNHFALHKQYPVNTQVSSKQLALISTKAQLASGLDGQTMESMDHYVKTVVRCWPQGVTRNDSELTDEPWNILELSGAVIAKGG